LAGHVNEVIVNDVGSLECLRCTKRNIGMIGSSVGLLFLSANSFKRKKTCRTSRIVHWTDPKR
jgi:hypothetical protein